MNKQFQVLMVRARDTSVSCWPSGPDYRVKSSPVRNAVSNESEVVDLCIETVLLDMTTQLQL